jgi:hypothetical protein
MATVNFPIFERLDIWNYGLFPGDKMGEPGLHIQFPEGLTLVIGTNGLGKTTLVTIIFRLLTGPFDIPGIAGRVDLGSVRLEPTALPRKYRLMFGQRVVDGARNARACLSFRLGEHVIVIERRLYDLALTNFKVDGAELPTEEGGSFQPQITKLVGVSSFADWILLLRHMTFYFEDRRALVWDASAQRQILRLLFLPPDISKKWTEDERSILVLDSNTRNIKAALFRVERSLVVNEQRLEASDDVRQELKTLEELHEVASARRETLETDLIEAEAERQQARLRLLTQEQERESLYRELERAKLIAIESRFPSRSETARFILAQLLTEKECLVCGSQVPDIAAQYDSRLEHLQCVICGTDLSVAESEVISTDLAVKRIERAASGLQGLGQAVNESRFALEEAERRFRIIDSELNRISSEIAERSLRIDHLVRQLPPEEAALRGQRSEMSLIRNRLERFRQELASRRTAFGDFVQEVNIRLASRAEEIKAAFSEAAEGFLLEECRLIWSPQKQRLGETGTPIEFPAFELDMTGADFDSPVRRTGPEQVSESQREFIDIAFRMALIAVAGGGGGSSLVIDAPESSLDAVFVARAAKVLSEFSARATGNRLLVTSNLVESRLIPTLIEKTIALGRDWALVDLLSIATPTAALRELRDEYSEVRDRLLPIGEKS